MKKIIVISFLCFLALFQNRVNAQWDLKYSNHMGWGFCDLHFFDADTGYVIGIGISGNASVLLKTVDGGQTWDSIIFSGNYAFKAIDFPCRDTGYIAFSNSYVNVLRTIDGGTSWQQISNNINIGNTQMDIDFYESKTGVLSLGGYCWKTTDAGISWDLITTHPGALQASISDSIYAGSGGNSISYTYDTCATFFTTVIYNNTSGTNIFLKGTEASICALGQNGTALGYAHLNYGVIAIGDLLSSNFRVYHFPYPQIYQMRDIEATQNFYYAVTQPFGAGSGGQFLKSIDGGYTWYSQSFADTADMFFVIEQIFCVNDSVCYATGGGNIYKTSNGGGPLIQQMGFQYNVGIDETNLSELIQVFPNPSNGEFTIQSEKLIEEIYVFDITGKLILQQALNSYLHHVNILIPGIYIVKIKTEAGTVNKKIIRY